MIKQTIIGDEVLKKKVTKFGNAAHIPMSKRFIDKIVHIVIPNVPVKVTINARDPRQWEKSEVKKK